MLGLDEGLGPRLLQALIVGSLNKPSLIPKPHLAYNPVEWLLQKLKTWSWGATYALAQAHPPPPPPHSFIYSVSDYSVIVVNFKYHAWCYDSIYSGIATLPEYVHWELTSDPRHMLHVARVWLPAVL